MVRTCICSPQNSHEGRHHWGWHGEDGGAQGEAEHLLGPVQEGPGVRSQGLATSEAVIELEAGLGADEGCVVHRALHEELVLEAALVQVARHQRLQGVPEPVFKVNIHPYSEREKSAQKK